ncbi:hypothetical protein J2790_001892 [Paenarthrobacter nicotinovorans]|nr:hypothetical protein [Paenarthrobacter nicotinovorans]SCZ56664.1 hypothetical protein SAMN02799638_01923 [Arthrobacter sp. UNCCL28]
MTTAMLRLGVGRNPLDSQLTSLIGELSTLSSHFRRDWDEHDVHEHSTGQKVFRHPDVGSICLTFDVFEMAGDYGLSIVTYSPDPGTADADRIALLSSLDATPRFQVGLLRGGILGEIIPDRPWSLSPMKTREILNSNI